MHAWLSLWARRNGCSSEAPETRLASDVTLLEYGDCAQGATSRMYTLTGSGHIWPGGLKLPEFGTGHYSASINATELMWEFFLQHPLRAAVSTP